MRYLDARPRLRSDIGLPDGRRLGYAEYGSPDGRPVLFVPGAATSAAMSFGGPLLPALGVRLVSVDRPGLGRSTGDPGGGFASFGEDVAVLLDRLGLRDVAVVANSQGAPFAIACAGLPPVASLTLVSPSDEVAHPAVREQLPQDLGDLVDLVARDPVAAETVLAGFDADRMLRLVLASAPASDEPVYGDPGFIAVYRQALEEGFAAGPEGYVRDTRLAMAPWALRLDAVPAPVAVWMGADDRSHSPDGGRFLACRLGGAHQVVPGVGGSLLWAHAATILASLGPWFR